MPPKVGAVFTTIRHRQVDASAARSLRIPVDCCLYGADPCAVTSVRVVLRGFIENLRFGPDGIVPNPPSGFYFVGVVVWASLS